MAVTRPWVIPQEVKDYSDYQAVKDRADAKIAIDITRAEERVIAYTNNRFDAADLTAIPSAVKTAVILLAEAFAYNATISRGGIMKSETFDDYSYTLSEASPIDIPSLDIASLLDEYTIQKARGGITMRLRKL